MKVLFFCADYFEIHKVIEKGIQDHFNSEIKTIIFKDYVYKNIFQKIQNFIFKTFFNTNLKKIWTSKQAIESIGKDEKFDYLFIICPEFLTNEDLEFVRKKSKKSIVYYWDSFDNIPRYVRTIPYFDKHFSFEPKDVDKYNFNFLTNFYFKTENREITENDVFFIGSYDKRFKKILEINKYLESLYKNTKFYVHTKNKKVVLENKSTKINFIDKTISILETEKMLKKSTIILDIQKEIQNGLTFRVFEALGHKKKLITTNKDIENYDFYNPNNIFVWENKTIEIPNSFFDSPYEDLDPETYEKYSIENWIKTIFEE